MIRYICGLTVAATVAVMGGSVSAQSPSAQSQASSNSLTSKVDSILTAVAPVGHIVLATGSVYVRNSHSVLCAAANVGTEPITVLVRIVTSDGTVTNALDTPVLVEPGQTIYQSNSAFPADFRRCEFEFDGAANNIRGTLTYIEGANPPHLVIDAR